MDGSPAGVMAAFSEKEGRDSRLNRYSAERDASTSAYPARNLEGESR